MEAASNWSAPWRVAVRCRSGGAARRIGRDVKAVHGDVAALLAAGILQKTADGKIVFPFDAIRVDMLLRAA